jgi:hypothetical protein
MEPAEVKPQSPQSDDNRSAKPVWVVMLKCWGIFVLMLFLFIDSNGFGQQQIDDAKTKPFSQMLEDSNYTTTFYASSKLALEGRCSDIYAPASAVSLAGTAYDRAAHQILPNFSRKLVAMCPYFPLVLLLLSPLTFLSPANAFVAWQIVSITALSVPATAQLYIKPIIYSFSAVLALVALFALHHFQRSQAGKPNMKQWPCCWGSSSCRSSVLAFSFKISQRSSSRAPRSTFSGRRFLPTILLAALYINVYALLVLIPGLSKLATPWLLSVAYLEIYRRLITHAFGQPGTTTT